MQRKDLLLDSSESSPMTPDEEAKLRKLRDIGGMYLNMTNTTGWKHLLENYLSKRLSQDEYLNAKVDDLADIRAAQKALFDLLRYVNKTIDDGQKAYEKLQKGAN